MTRSEGDPVDDQPTTASMADLKLMETSLISSMDTKFAEMRYLIKQLASGKVPKETTSLDDSASSHDGETEEEKEEKEKKKGVEDKETDPKKSSTSTTTPEGGKPEYHGVPFAYSPDPPIHHTRINPLGPPPKLND